MLLPGRHKWRPYKQTRRVAIHGDLDKVRDQKKTAHQGRFIVI
jgi:hypothetical protein